MLNLTASSHRLRVESVIPTDVDVHVSYADLASGVVTLGLTNTAMTTATTIDAASGPSSGSRNVRLVSIRNKGTLPTFIVVTHYDGTTSVELHRQFLAPQGQIHYSEATGFQLSTAMPRAGIHGATASGSGALILPMVNATAMTVTGATAANRLDAFPFIPAIDLTVDQLALETTTVFAGGLFKLAVYADAGNGTPGALIIGTTDLTTDALGYKAQTIAATLLSAGTLYWLAAHYSSATAQHRAVPIAAAYPYSAPAAGTSVFTLWRGVQTYAAGLPATFPLSTATSSVIPAIRLRTA